MEDNIYSVLTTGYVIYYYDFMNSENKHIQTGKAIFNLQGFPLELTSSLIKKEDVGKKIQCIVGYNGKNWKILEIK